jgi:uncharacterized protein (DUF952 family)
MEATRLGSYGAPSLESDGYIHCSTSRQVLPVARQFYGGQTGLVLLVIDPRRLTSVVKWERPAEDLPPSGIPEGQAFPHVYGPLNLEAVVGVLDFESDAEGNLSLPASFQTSA